jgi:hypothetical protein
LPPIRLPPKAAPIENRWGTARPRPWERRRAPIAIGIAFGVVVVAASVFWLTHRTGRIAINLADSKGNAVPFAAIYVDGKKECEVAPCIVPGVAAGSHTLKVEATGFEAPADKAVAVESREDTTVDFSLVRTTNGGTGIRVTGTQPGATLFLDDKEVGPLPQELHDMGPGTYKVRVAGSERYAPLERTVTLAKDEFQDLGAVTLKVITGKATISSGTPGARVFIVSGTERREVPSTPLSVDLDASKPWSLVGTKAGFSDYILPINFDDGKAEKSFTVTFDNAVPAGDSSPYRPAPASPAAAHASTSQPPPNDVAPAGQAFLNINSIPVSMITLDGKPIGSTPKLKYRVSPGAHSVVFFNADQRFKKQISVAVAAGETKAAIGRN